MGINVDHLLWSRAELSEEIQRLKREKHFYLYLIHKMRATQQGVNDDDEIVFRDYSGVTGLAGKQLLPSLVGTGQTST